MPVGRGSDESADSHAGRREASVVLCVDVEPDPRVFDRAEPPPWKGFEQTVERIRPLRERLSEKTGQPVAFTWYLRMDPQIEQTWGSAAWVAEQYGDLLSELSQAGDELGLHTHLWRWDSGTNEWLEDFSDPVWAEFCAVMGFEAFESSFGERCATHRGGDRYLSGALLPILASHGVNVDLTVEPGMPPLTAQEGETVRGPAPDYRAAPPGPYRASPESFPGPDPSANGSPLLLPLASAPRLRPPFRRLPLLLGDPPKGFARRLALERLRAPRRPQAFALRTDAGLDSGFWETVSENLDHLAGRRQLSFRTASAAV